MGNELRFQWVFLSEKLNSIILRLIVSNRRERLKKQNEMLDLDLVLSLSLSTALSSFTLCSLEENEEEEPIEIGYTKLRMKIKSKHTHKCRQNRRETHKLNYIRSFDTRVYEKLKWLCV